MIIALIRIIGAFGALVLFTLVSAYVFKFGKEKSGINFDYALFSLVVLVALMVGRVL